MKDFIKCLIDDLKGNPLGVIMLIVFGMVVYNSFGGNSSYSGGDVADYEYERDLEYAEAAEEQLIEDHLREIEDREQEIESNSLYFINNGYYLHRDINCKGLDGYSNDDLNRISIEDSYDYQYLSPCNWCVNSNN